MEILKYIVIVVLGLTLLAIGIIALYTIWFLMIPAFYKDIKERWFNK